MKRDVFLSYSKHDVDLANSACRAIESSGLTCWIAPRDIVGGEEWPDAIVRGINTSRALVLIFSAEANDSVHIKREVERAVHRRMPIIPYRIDNVPFSSNLEYFISTAHWIEAWQMTPEESLITLAEHTCRLLNHSFDRSTFVVGKIPPRRRKIGPGLIGAAVGAAAVVAGLTYLGMGHGPGPRTASAQTPAFLPAIATPGEAPAVTPAAVAPVVKETPPVQPAPKPAPAPVQPVVTPVVVVPPTPTPTPPVPAPAQPLATTGFRAGDYVCVSGQRGDLSVTGPFPADDKRQTWLYTGLLNGTWTTGPVTRHPQLMDVPVGAVFPTGWSFGLSNAGNVIAVRQLDDKLVITEPRKSTNQWNDPVYSVEGAIQYIFQLKPASAGQ